MWYLTEIPKIAHFYFGGGKLLHIRYLSLKTFIKQNPDWQVIFWYPIEPFKGRSWGTEFNPLTINEKKCNDYFAEALQLPVIPQPIDFKRLGFRNNMAEVHKNDYIRINALYLYGGVWSDTDIIYFNSIEKLKVNNPGNKNKKVFVCISDYGHSTGFNMASSENEFFGHLLDSINKEYKSNSYQCLGPDIFNKYFKTLDSIPDSVNIDMDSVYEYNCHHVRDLLINKPPRFNENSIGCHWYGGNTLWSDFLNDTNGGEINLPDNIIGNLIKNAI